VRHIVIVVAAKPCPRCGGRMVVVDTTRATEHGLTVHRECDGCGHEEIGTSRERGGSDALPTTAPAGARDARGSAESTNATLQA
jgi:hypothetical protein